MPTHTIALNTPNTVDVYAILEKDPSNQFNIPAVIKKYIVSLIIIASSSVIGLMSL